MPPKIFEPARIHLPYEESVEILTFSLSTKHVVSSTWVYYAVRPVDIFTVIFRLDKTGLYSKAHRYKIVNHSPRLIAQIVLITRYM